MLVLLEQLYSGIENSTHTLSLVVAGTSDQGTPSPSDQTAGTFSPATFAYVDVRSQLVHDI